MVHLPDPYLLGTALFDAISYIRSTNTSEASQQLPLGDFTCEEFTKGIWHLLSSGDPEKQPSVETIENVGRWLIGEGAVVPNDGSRSKGFSVGGKGEMYSIVGVLGTKEYIQDMSRDVQTERIAEAVDVARAVLTGAATGAECAAFSSEAAHAHLSLRSFISEHDRELLTHLRPETFTDDAPKVLRRGRQMKYHMVVIGGGVTGLVSAIGSAGVGARVALVEKSLLGGDCLNVGCVPSKALLAAAHRVHELKRSVAGTDGDGISVQGGEVQVDFAKVMERVRQVRAAISHHDGVARLRSCGVDVYLGSGQFIGNNIFEVNGAKLKFEKAVIGTGARAALPPIRGLYDNAPLTNATVFNLTKLPPKMVVIGGGVVGCELAQAFAMLGSDVTLLARSGRILPKEDLDAAKIVQAAMIASGVKMMLDVQYEKVTTVPGQDRVEEEDSRWPEFDEAFSTRQSYVYVRRPGPDGEMLSVRLECNAVLVAAGRVPNVSGLGLEAAGVRYDAATGVHVDDKLRTSNSDIFAAGDVAMKEKYTHAADFAARIIIGNALFFKRLVLSDLVIPRATFTYPEIASVGLIGADNTGGQTSVVEKQFADVDRCICQGDTVGFVRIYLGKGDKIAGATVVGTNAGELISEITLAMKAKVGPESVSRCYPSISDEG